MPRVVTANRLRTGEVVYLADGGCWSPSLGDALTADDTASASNLQAIAARDVASNKVVGAYLMDVRIETGIPRPVSMREVIRAGRGPTI